MLKTSLLVLLLLSVMEANAADIYFSGNFVSDARRVVADPNIPKHLVISGAIKPGDLHKLLSLAGTNPAYFFISLDSVELDSPGGDIREAMRMATVLADLYPTIGVTEKCASSCVLLWLSGAMHSAKPGQIGIHRPYFDPAYFRDLSLPEAKRRYAELNTRFKTFVLKQGLPESLYEKLNATPSGDVYWLTAEDLSLTGVSPPFFQEKLLASCGQFMSDDDHELLKAVACEQEMVVPERIGVIDAILGDKKDKTWEAFKESL